MVWILYKNFRFSQPVIILPVLLIHVSLRTSTVRHLRPHDLATPLPHCYKWLEFLDDWQLREMFNNVHDDNLKRRGSPNGTVRIHVADGDDTRLEDRFVTN
jgi:hypothetical protein